MTKYVLLQFFWEIIQVAINMEPNKYGSPVSHLLECMMLYQEQYLEKILQERDLSFEMRLNGAGLKMYINNTDERGYITIGGDQADLYPEFVERVRELIKEHQLERRS
ncbi:MAG: hypothetical protein ACQ5SW_07800 [Sphaerochaetaceae bacterium]